MVMSLAAWKHWRSPECAEGRAFARALFARRTRTMRLSARLGEACLALLTILSMAAVVVYAVFPFELSLHGPAASPIIRVLANFAWVPFALIFLILLPSRLLNELEDQCLVLWELRRQGVGNEIALTRVTSREMADGFMQGQLLAGWETWKKAAFVLALHVLYVFSPLNGFVISGPFYTHYPMAPHLVQLLQMLYGLAIGGFMVMSFIPFLAWHAMRQTLVARSKSEIYMRTLFSLPIWFVFLHAFGLAAAIALHGTPVSPEMFSATPIPNNFQVNWRFFLTLEAIAVSMKLAFAWSERRVVLLLLGQPELLDRAP